MATKKQLKDFVIKLRKKDDEFEKQQKFCRDHNFHFEEQIFEAKAQLVRGIVHEMERDFDLGFVWDESLNE